MIVNIGNRIKKDQREIVISTEKKDIFLISEEYTNILYLNQKEYFYVVGLYDNVGFDNNIDFYDSKIYELVFNEKLSNFLMKRIIKGILQFKILSIPSFFINFDNQQRYKNAYEDIKEIYKDLIKIGIHKKLTLKEKLIIKLLV